MCGRGTQCNRNTQEQCPHYHSPSHSFILAADRAIAEGSVSYKGQGKVVSSRRSGGAPSGLRNAGCCARAASWPPRARQVGAKHGTGRIEVAEYHADDLPAEVKKSFNAMVEAEAAFRAALEKLLKNEGHMPEDKFLVMSRKGKRLGVAYASTPRGEGGAGSLKFKTK